MSTPHLSPDFTDQLNRHGIPQELHEHLRAVGVGSLVEKLGIVFSEFTAEKTVATMPVAGNTQPYGLLHGGASAALVESVGSFAANLHAGAGRAAAGVDLNITHLRPALSGTVTATCTAVKLGKTLCVHSVDIVNDAGKLIATGRITNALIDLPKSASVPHVP
ncbi:PaaI family thioesterase [Rothia sp. ZJ1223]|uniref:PaaI family thioesterase n=1 Tax=Rothia sp. ZJ1223 TaxID=2811098 RepID=UPI00195B6B77|nr:PaaI family thioesterase [Rothia sp. ZJ1223]MBM7050644.1 PaaI family thioesterase [Rothia sp. ZJ1223]